MVKAGYNPQAAVELQETFVKLSGGASKQDPISALFASHPPSQERVDKNRKKATKLAGGTRNRSAFQKAIASLKKDQAAYDLNIQALKKAADDDLEGALALSQSAISKQPKETLFHLTKGRILMAMKRNKEAAKSLASAQKLNPDYFLPALLNGLNAKILGDNGGAKTSLLNSMQLLATPVAAYHLGELELVSGNTAAARSYFESASQDSGEIGQRARQQLETLN